MDDTSAAVVSSPPLACEPGAALAIATRVILQRLTWRRIFLVLGVLATASSAALVYWLTRRPYTYQARRARSHATAVVSPAVVTDAGAPAADAAIGDADVSDAAPAIESPPEPVQTQRARTPNFAGTENYLFVGVDRTRSGGFGRADTLIVAIFDDESHHVGLVSIPRDLQVEIPDHGPARINAALRVAARTGVEPLELLSDLVSDVLALDVHHVVVGDIAALEDTVDRLDGVEVDVPCSIRDNFIDPRTEDGRRILDVEAGRRRMDGVTVAMYVRSRHGRSDWSRARRQQAVLFGIKNRVRELGPTEWIPILSGALDEGVLSTMSRFELIRLARRVGRLRPDRLHGLLVGHREVHAHRTEDGHSVLLADPEAIDAALARLFDAPAPGTLPEHGRCRPVDAALR